MQFLYPTFLWAALAIAIPIIIHLFYFRRFKKVYFTNVKYLQEIKEETSNRNKLKNLLTLLMRILAVISLVMAFALPFMSDNKMIGQGQASVSVYIDNSQSMSSTIADVPLLERAKEKAREIVSTYSDNDKFQILTNEFKGKHQRFVTKEDAISFIDEIEITPLVHTLDQVVKRQLQLLSTQGQAKQSYLISDFQSNIFDLNTPLDTSVQFNMLPIRSGVQQNISIDSVWLSGPIPLIKQSNQLIIKIKNWSSQDMENVRISLTENGQSKPIGNINIQAGETIIDTASIPISQSGVIPASVSINDYPVTFDDTYFVALHVPDSIQILHIFDKNSNSNLLDAVFARHAQFNIDHQSVQQLQYQSFKNYNLIIIDDITTLSSGFISEIKTFVSNGGKLLIFPPKNLTKNTYNFLAASLNINPYLDARTEDMEVGKINTNDFIFSDVYLKISDNLKLPKVNYYYPLTNIQQIPTVNLLTLKNGMPYLVKNSLDKGMVFTCISPLDKTFNDLVLNPEVFVPMLFKMAISTTVHKPLSYPITNNVVVETESLTSLNDEILEVNGPSKFIPGITQGYNNILLNFGDQAKDAGYYDLLNNKVSVDKFALNYDRKESNLTLETDDNLKSYCDGTTNVRYFGDEMLANLSDTVGYADRGGSWWKYFLFAALAFLLFESLLLRYYKTN
ncbi:MAG: BatA domain-containing protein [Saprospiraceae bacterium]